MRSVPVPPGYELRTTLSPLALGRGDRTVRFLSAEVAWRATRTPDGPGTACYRRRGDDDAITVEAWGPGAAWLLEHAPAVLGADDDLADAAALAAAHSPVVARLHQERPGIRFGASLNVFECLVPTICAQKVTGLEAKQAWRGIVGRWGEPAPGPLPGLRLPPAPEAIAAAGYEQFHRMGLERRRADLLRRVAREADRLQAVVTATPQAAEDRLRTVPGIGVWTAAKVRHVAMGDADAVPYGDYHLPSQVSWTMLGRRDGTDELMYELLEPFAPHRGRVVRLIEVGGSMKPRRGPRMAPSGMHRR